jgi:hypothetical protein
MNTGKVCYSVTRVTPKGSRIYHPVGDFDTLNDARKAMFTHWQHSAKRGTYHYAIEESEVHISSGVEMLCKPLTAASLARSERYYPIGKELKQIKRN